MSIGVYHDDFSTHRLRQRQVVNIIFRRDAEEHGMGDAVVLASDAALRKNETLAT